MKKVTVKLEFLLYPGEEEYTKVAHLQIVKPKDPNRPAFLKADIKIIEESVEWLEAGDSPQALADKAERGEE